MGERSEPPLTEVATVVATQAVYERTNTVNTSTLDHEDLSDVSLDVPLVPDDPRLWVVPRNMMRYENLMDWWDDLVATDGFRPPIPKERADLLVGLAKEYEQAVALAFDGLATVPQQARIRSAIRSALHEGLTISQVAILFGTTDNRIVADLYCNIPNFTQEDAEVRLRAEGMLRGGGSVKEVCAATGMTSSQVTTLCASINVTPPRVGAANSPKPAEAKEITLRMKAEGHSNGQVSKHLHSLGYKVAPSTVSKWWTRHNGKVGQ